jgi:hypothetical protein
MSNSEAGITDLGDESDRLMNSECDSSENLSPTF